MTKFFDYAIASMIFALSGCLLAIMFSIIMDAVGR
ncbi:hypothetical protein SA12KD_52 [Escherichia phage vB_EcoS_SA12KD]|nr:hypothetical protein SA12KD_52 [Escherichia phage vB_EcoS_SA12KD]